jgi:tRNA(Ile)-lysidine synthase TilS/MesJ
MFEVENLNEFINRMFDNAIESNSNVKTGLATFRKYLADTQMCDEEYLKVLDKVIECSNELIELKKKFNNMDIVSFVSDALNNQKKPKQKKKTQIKNNYVTSNSCGTGRTSSSDRCGSSSSSSSRCGGGSYTDRC